ncbi:tRNA (5-methylaminomethyl-2-thiouridine)(34)-methyltransferase MnmD [Dokdonia sp. Hel_I_53]|uniref:tRNA (5-methylaminomethyl-2-thiouridine)(34)-methyltransferase MnmD n=1 Tax=Dokdonia sp. Hel_I_53 TaxID=1566287 RepID=UPI00119BA659|nr:tRNA (5-methylaminomethyl-2-thiouridine)(34)-methyltransferase MnmD [Dokdonia sp. Hel_I_53]TVZ53016.1 tRNA U34 5-methylaminomethyl-2-thiouridine-forming methyltransferase MnmC [Dokdonia sp. Hel_I_53]
MKREIITTADGSKTIHIPEWNEQYHSKHGAIQEARHVFLETGLSHYMGKFPEQKEVAILEMGFGTGLNALLTYYEVAKYNVSFNYVGAEAYPVSLEEASAMEYARQLQDGSAEMIYTKLHNASWEQETKISDNFKLTKRKQRFEDIADSEVFDVIYFDAFGPRVQPTLWTEEIFTKMFNALRPSGVLTTYCAQGAARRAMQTVGFQVERLPGPPGKREMLRATKV